MVSGCRCSINRALYNTDVTWVGHRRSPVSRGLAVGDTVTVEKLFMGN